MPASTILWQLHRQAITQRVHAKWIHCSLSRQCNCSLPSPIAKHEAKAQKVFTSVKAQTAQPPSDHRDIGTAFDLFSTNFYSPGSHLFHPDGAHIFLKLQEFLRAQYGSFGFREVITPIIYKQSIWEQSGHWENYKSDMYKVTGRGAMGQGKNETAEIGENESYGLKPMNCPGHCLLFKTKTRSYRDLPVRFADFSPLHRNEISGALSGLTRVRRFHQDDGHIFCRPIQVGEEIQKTLAFLEMAYRIFGLGPYKLVLSTRPKDKFIGTLEDWDRAEAQLKTALKNSGRDWTVNPGDGAFYGPKIDIILTDSNGYEHQTATIQLDFQLPQRFGLTYVSPAPQHEAKGEETTDPRLLMETGNVTPVMIHRAIFGSLERFMALLIEHYKGHWPFWLSPRQAIILTVNESKEVLKFVEYVAQSLTGSVRLDEKHNIPRSLGQMAFMVDVDSSSRKLVKKIQEAKSKCYNIICVVGEGDLAHERLSVDITGHRNYESIIMSDVDSFEIVEKDKWQNPKAIQLKLHQLTHIMKALCNRYQ